MNHSIRIFFMAFIVAGVLRAGEAAPEKPAALQPSTWRPYKEMQDVLYFESFEHGTTVAEKGKLVSEEPVAPGGHAWKLETGAGESLMLLHLSQIMDLKVPHGMPTAQLFVQINIYAEEPGVIQFKAVTQKNEQYAKDIVIPKIKTWNVVSVKVSELKNGNKAAAEAENVWKELEIHVKPPPKKKEVPKAWVDDVLITTTSNATEAHGRAVAADKKRLDIEKQFERDGFSYSMAVNENLKTLAKGFKSRIKQKRAIVMGPTPEMTAALKDQIKIAAPKLKESTFTFDPFDDAGEGEKPVGGLGDMRTLLFYNLQRDPLKVPEFVVLAPSADEALGPGRPPEVLRTAILRSLECGTIPIVCVPSPSKPEDKEKIDGFAKTVDAICHQLGVPLVNGGFAPRNAKGEVEVVKAGANPMERTALMAMTAMKHVRDSIAKD